MSVGAGWTKSARATLGLVLLLIATSGPAAAQLRGHGGPVRALAVSADAQTLVSGSFDSRAIRWSLPREAAEQVLRFHEGTVNAVAILPGGRVATAGQDRRIALWRAGVDRPDAVLEGHEAPIAALAASADGALLASAAWDHTVRLWPLGGGPPRVLEGHQDNVNGVAFTPDGRAVVSAGYDRTLRIWPRAGGAPLVVASPTPLNGVAVARDGEIVTGGADGKLYFLAPDGRLRGDLAVGATPILAVALAKDGVLIAAVGIGGPVAIVERAQRRLVRTLVVPGLPVWSAAFMPDSRTVLTGGADGAVRRWNALTGDDVGSVAAAPIVDPLARYAGDRGATVFRACVACHTLSRDAGNRAGPTLAGLFGRRIASLPGYDYSPALKHLDIVWTPETVAKLFELGPATYTPGTKMPEQRITAADDRAALVRFLEKATKQ
jgi:cytochrome c